MKLKSGKISNKKYPTLKEYKKEKKDNFFIKMLSLGLILTPLMISSCQKKEVNTTKKEVNKSSDVNSGKKTHNSVNGEKNKKLPVLKEKERSKRKVTVKTIIDGDKQHMLLGMMKRKKLPNYDDFNDAKYQKAIDDADKKAAEDK